MNNEENLKKIALKVLDNAGLSQDAKFGSAIAILMLASIILTCIRILQECNQKSVESLSTPNDKYAIYAEQVHSYSRIRGKFIKMKMKRILRQNMTQQDYEKYSMKLINSLLNTGEHLTDEEIKTLVEAANV